MNTNNILMSKIECLRTLARYRSDTITELTTMLKDEKLVSFEDLDKMGDGDRIINLYLLLTKRLAEDKILLFDFEWIKLPNEFIKVTVVTQSGTKTFSYSAA